VTSSVWDKEVWAGPSTEPSGTLQPGGDWCRAYLTICGWHRMSEFGQTRTFTGDNVNVTPTSQEHCSRLQQWHCHAVVEDFHCIHRNRLRCLSMGRKPPKLPLLYGSRRPIYNAWFLVSTTIRHVLFIIWVVLSQNSSPHTLLPPAAGHLEAHRRGLVKAIRTLLWRGSVGPPLWTDPSPPYRISPENCTSTGSAIFA